MSKSKKTRNKSRKARSRFSNAQIARYWAASEDCDTAFDKYIAAITYLLDADKLTDARVEAILSYLTPEDMSPFIKDLEDTAANQISQAVDGDGTEFLVKTRLFGIPVPGVVEEIESDMPERRTQIAKALRTSGFCPQQSNIVIIPVCLPLIALSHITPGDLNIITKGLRGRSTARDNMTPEDHADMERAVTLLTNIADNYTNPQSDNKEKESGSTATKTMGHRFLIGMETTFSSMDVTTLVDPFTHGDTNDSILFGDALQHLDYDENDGATVNNEEYFDNENLSPDDFDQAIDAWNSLLNTDEENLYHISLPTPWSELRTDLLTSHVEQCIAMATTDEDYTNGEAVSHLLMKPDDSGLTIIAMKNDTIITSTFLPRELLMVDSEEFLENLSSTYGIEVDEYGIEWDDALDEHHINPGSPIGAAISREGHTLH